MDKQKVDKGLLLLILALTIFGLVMLYSTSVYNGRVKFADPAYYLKKQFFATSIGWMVMYLTSLADYRRQIRLADAVFVLSVELFTTVRFIGDAYKWSRR